MRVAVVFVLFLCFHLLGRYDYANAAHGSNKFYSAGQHSGKTEQVEIPTTDGGSIFTAADGLKEGKDHLVSVDDEDEEELVSRKSILLDKYFSAFYYAFIASHSFNAAGKIFSSYESFSNTGTCIYLEQRVLRI